MQDGNVSSFIVKQERKKEKQERKDFSQTLLDIQTWQFFLKKIPHSQQQQH